MTDLERIVKVIMSEVTTSEARNEAIALVQRMNERAIQDTVASATLCKHGYVYSDTLNQWCTTEAPSLPPPEGSMFAVMKHIMDTSPRQPFGIGSKLADAYKFGSRLLGAYGWPQPISNEAYVRYCPECGSISLGGIKLDRPCCPDSGAARMVPKKFAEKCKSSFDDAIKYHTEYQELKKESTNFPGQMAAAYLLDNGFSYDYDLKRWNAPESGNAKDMAEFAALQTWLKQKALSCKVPGGGLAAWALATLMLLDDDNGRKALSDLENEALEVACDVLGDMDSPSLMHKGALQVLAKLVRK